MRSLWTQHQSWLLPLAIFTVALVVNLSLLPVYGVSWDEPLHFNWGKLFILFWRSDSREFLEAMPGHGVYYGPLTYALNYSLSEVLFKQLGWSLVAANHVLTMCLYSLSIMLVFLLGRQMFGRIVGLLSVLLFVLYPPLIAHGQYNPKDIPLLAAFTLAVLMVDRAQRKPTLIRVVLAGVSFGIAITAKITALILLPILLLAGSLYLLWGKRHPKHWPWAKGIRVLAVFTVSAVAGVFLFWPSLWGEPLLLQRSLRFFSTGDFWGGHVLYFGSDYSAADLPWHYIPFQLVLSTPLPTLIFFGLGCAAMAIALAQAWKKVSHKSLHPQTMFAYALLLCWFFLPFLYSLKPGLVRYDGLRQFFFIIPALCIVAAVGLQWFLQLLAKRYIPFKKSLMLLLASAIITVWVGAEIVYVHPYQGSYVNAALLPMLPTPIDRNLELEYWGVTYKEGAEWLNDNAQRNSVVCVPIAGIIVEWYVWRPDIRLGCDKASNYIMFFTRYSYAQDYKFTEQLVPVFTVSRYGASLLKIYEIK